MRHGWEINGMSIMRPFIEDLQKLPLRAVVALAYRAARRVQSLVSDSAVDLVERAITFAQNFVEAELPAVAVAGK